MNDAHMHVCASHDRVRVMASMSEASMSEASMSEARLLHSHFRL